MRLSKLGGRYVCYSPLARRLLCPKITYGVDFNNIEHGQDLFIYSKGNSIPPSGGVPTRDTDFVYGKMESKDAMHETLEALKQDYKQGVEISMQLTDMCN